MQSLYTLDYYENMLRIYSKTAEEINHLRWEWIADCHPKCVLDYGCGVGWFRAFRPQGVEVFSYDIGPYPQTGIELRMYDVVCLWDVLEHIRDFSEIEPILALARNVALTMPMKPLSKDFACWKHFKPGEHLHYWTSDTLDAFMKRHGFEIKKHGQPECPPREDVDSYVYARRGQK